MSAKTLNCEQAIFTSVRTPMGEGYRIIAASRGLGAKEKQIITRHSPSHEGLCESSRSDQQRISPSPREGSVEGLACTFYALTEGRHCISLICPAGAEHTGRGGQRIYTHTVVVTEEDLRTVGYNPFVILRSMLTQGYHEPQLKPPQILPPAELQVTGLRAQPPRLAMHNSLQTPHRCRLLEGLLAGGTFVVNVAGNWLDSAEAVMLGIPGPMRPAISFGAGVRFSVGRIGRLNVLYDDSLATRSKLVGQPVEYVDPITDEAERRSPSEWVSFVERHWASSDTAMLAKRTSRTFSDCTPNGLNRIAGLYNRIDKINCTESIELLRQVKACFVERTSGTEAEVSREFQESALKALLARIKQARWNDLIPLWNLLVATGQDHVKGMPFAAPLMEAALRIAMRDEPPAAARVALDIVTTSFATMPGSGGGTVFVQILEQLHRWTKANSAHDAASMLQLCERWSAVDIVQHNAKKQQLLNEIRLSFAVESSSN